MKYIGRFETILDRKLGISRFIVAGLILSLASFSFAEGSSTAVTWRTSVLGATDAQTAKLMASIRGKFSKAKTAAQATIPERSQRPVWRAVPLVKNNLKAAEAMSNILKEFSGAKSKTEERAILKKYLRENYVDPVQTTRALYACFYYGSKHSVRLAQDEERFLDLSSKRVSDAFAAHMRLADPAVIEYAKAAVLFYSSEHFFNLPSQTIRNVYQLFKKDPHFPWLLIAFEASLSLRDKQNRLALYNETKTLYDSFPERSVYIHSSDSRNSRIKLQAHLVLMSFTLYKSCNLDWGLEAAVAHYNELMRFNNPDQEVRMTQKRVRALREQFNF